MNARLTEQGSDSPAVLIFDEPAPVSTIGYSTAELCARRFSARRPRDLRCAEGLPRSKARVARRRVRIRGLIAQLFRPGEANATADAAASPKPACKPRVGDRVELIVLGSA